MRIRRHTLKQSKDVFASSLGPHLIFLTFSIHIKHRVPVMALGNLIFKIKAIIRLCTEER